jgi:tetratricopeptide (TPR) repeat protein
MGGIAMHLEDAHQARRSRKYRKALELYKLALDEDKQNAEALGGLGLTYTHMNDKENAVLAARSAIAVDGHQPLAHIALAYVHHANGELEEYRNEAEKAFALNPHFYEVACTYSHMLLNDKRIDEALAVIVEIAETNPARACPHYYLGWIYVYKKQYKSALPEYIKAFRAQPSFDLTRYILSTLVNYYWPWSTMLFAIPFFALVGIWYFSMFFSKLGLITLGGFLALVTLTLAIKRFRNRQLIWGAVYLILLVMFVYSLHLFYSHM